jgi:para-nitrobenzyl esterase
MKKSVISLVGLAFLVVAGSCQNNTPKSTIVTDTIKADSVTAIVQTESGKIAGYIDNNVFNFKGIPYAQAERFMPPTKVTPWKGVRSTRSYGSVCPINVASTVLNDEMEFVQQHNFANMNENCLNLNVWTQGINDGKKRPVMVWLHGGGYTAGSSCELPTYDGLNLSKSSDVVVVSVNHRLNVLGFLDLSGVSDKYKYSANAGMLDLVAALEWVKTNIANFGGDPGNVTIFGQSGGGGKVCTLMQMPKAKGLFQKAISQSGAAGALKEKSTTSLVGFAILEELGFKPNQVDSLKNVPFTRLLEAGNNAVKKVAAKLGPAGGLMGMLGWAPSMDGDVIPFQVGTPEAEAISKDIPLMIGTNKNEFAALMGNSLKPNATEADVKEALQKQYGDKTDAYISAYKSAFPNDAKPSEMMSIDLMFRPMSLNFANQKSAVKDAAPVYMYLFTWQSPILDGELKAVHCMEIAFVFNNIARNRQQSGDSKEAYALAEIMSKTWARFAATGDPNGKGLPEWPAYSADNGQTMFFDNSCAVRAHHDKDLLAVVTKK